MVENAWAQEFRSPTGMMQELIAALRQHSLHIFRHRKGMLFVSPVRARPFQHDSASVSQSVSAILEALTANPGINRKQLQEILQPNETVAAEDAEKKKLALASNLHWLIGEGHVIEFNDGALDLPRMKPPAAAQPVSANGKAQAPPSAEESTEAPVAVAGESAPPVQEEAPAAAEENIPAVEAESEPGAKPETGEEKLPAAD